jgi:hypothetical protein
MTVMAISISALFMGAPAVNAATPASLGGNYEKAPDCVQWYADLPSSLPDPWETRATQRKACVSYVLWDKINKEIKAVNGPRTAAARAKINAKYYWAVAAPLTKGATKNAEWKRNFETMSFTAGKAAASPKKSAEFLTQLRNFVKDESSNYTQMATSVLVLKAINEIEDGAGLSKKVPKATRKIVNDGLDGSGLDTPLQVISSASIKLINESYLENSRMRLLSRLTILG